LRRETGASGAAQLWIDGNLEVDTTNANTNNSQYCQAGVIYAGASVTVIGDCFAVADTYIGPEAAEQTYTKTWTTDALFKKLGVQKALSVDTAFQKGCFLHFTKDIIC